MDGFTADQASLFTGCTAHQLRYWDRIGLVRPTVQATGGRPGVRRLYSFRDLVALRAVKSLLDSGMSLQRVRRAYDYLRKRAGLDEQLAGVKLTADGDSIMASSEGAIVDALREGQLAFFSALDKVAAGVDGKVAQYLYDRDGFVEAIRRVESNLERELHSSPRRAASS
ncbi:MAG TPA: helix-turn-helix domain-containing protein [Actinomycetota bacterium]|jgi:DNA-binding transcriptional MerR regulator|nr:helix-turn-helix domain-containing protein [Actinomycetota bacterium]